MANGVQGVQRPPEQSNGRPEGRFDPLNPLRPYLSQIARYWWVELVGGVLWLAISMVVLQFNHASVVTVGVLTGLMFLLFGAEEFALAAIDKSTRWLWIILGGLVTAGGIVCLAHPVGTFVGLADILGALFLLIAVAWMVQAFAERVINPTWWLTLISGVLMVGVAFWVSGQFFMTRAATLLIFAGIWAAMKGITDIVRALQVRRLGK